MLNLVSVIGILLGVFSQTIECQNCGCGPKACCSRFGICGTTNISCAVGCQQGTCTPPPPTVSDIVTPVFFNGMFSDGIIDIDEDERCSGNNFYSRDAFLDAVKSYPQFGNSTNDGKREIAAFFAHGTHETGKFCYIEEINGAEKDYCDEKDTENPCVLGKQYYGRGPFQITGNHIYGSAGRSIGFDGLGAPETVAKDPIISFKTALWFWMKNDLSVKLSNEGFGETIRSIVSSECNGGSPTKVKARVDYYTSYCNQLGVAPGVNLRC